MKEQRNKLKSTTFWFSLLTLLLVPASWFIDFFMRKNLIAYLIENKITDVLIIERLIVSIPTESIVSLATFTVSLYIGRKAGREVTTNLTLPVSKNATDIQEGR